MTDASMDTPNPRRKTMSLVADDARTKKRNASEKRFQAYGIAAIATGLFFLAVLAFSIVRSGLPAFTTTVVDVKFTMTQEQVDEAEGQLFKTKAYQTFFNTALQEKLVDEGIQVAFDEAAIERIMGKTGGTIREYYAANPDKIGEPVDFKLNASSRVDGYFKGRVKRETVQDSRFLMLTDLDLVDALADAGIIHTTFDWGFITGADSGVDNPGGAGIGASVVGSFFMMLVVLFLSLPIGVAASIYLEEFAPQNRWTDMIEVNISNLAAVPSIVFGILGLAVFIQFMHLPQSAPLVGGLVLTLMTLPTIIISTRASLKAVPPSIRDAALGVGASKMQAVFHHVLPLAMPGILTGTIIGLAQALGETAPLLLIGMVGFVARGYPDGFIGGFVDPNSAMPAQIYTWAARADQAFYEKAWGGIIILLIFLLTMNIIAIILRRRFERRW
ncbi:phosphate ABC transporter permease PstA [Mameliella sediminis]|uniref:phosphate ABC transporter permease PstA n=1 Tax=Mameliella sediminis TaxID=2836866 RepID=UPI001C48050A|nr:phosphate ABC transporter permease PstA [Mameliella sediminis]MBY6115746.1 phosphate ABC transporter permease PstA [Antarctobacter heliothermus]MBY6145993.1 phosphate ABC transporter permease PstA [Mameliella alba]MBV7393286.1 phosphate ABC transporter permease PstA [Mameliella sediminis]MBY6161315.1 phosphate ABC transporter permease PstA [Mameliella alba]MBY6169785.1 phosphate ABC transporter permease PstA [Mameliella alba]